MRKLLAKKSFKILLTVSVFVCFTVYAWLLVLVIQHSHAGHHVTISQNADAILVLGHASPGGIPSPWLIERMNRGAQLYLSGYAPLVIVSGGTGPRDMVAVAQIMSNHLTSMGIPKESILIEDRAANTYENFRYTYTLLSYYNINHLIVVTNGFHLFRSLMFGHLYFDNLLPVGAGAEPSLALFLAYLREPISIIYNFIRYMIF